MAPAFSAAIFDLDGTLVDSLRDIGRATNRALADLGLPEHPLDAYARFVGSGARVLCERALPADAQGRVDEALARFLVHYEAGLLHETCAYPGIDRLLADLAAADVTLAVLSNKPHDLTVRVVDQLFADVPFRRVLGHRPERFPKKPDPASTLDLCAELALDREATVFVGDTGVDMQTARAAGLRPVGVAWGFRDRDELSREGAEVILAAPAELWALP